MNFRIYVFLILISTNSAFATELVYHFQNPNFGGNPLNGPFLLNEANAQNSYKAPKVETVKIPKKTAIEQFTDKVETALFNKLATSNIEALTSVIVDPVTGNIVPGANADVGTYNISVSNVVEGDNGTKLLNVIISDGITNTNISVPYLNE